MPRETNLFFVRDTSSSPFQKCSSMNLNKCPRKLGCSLFRRSSRPGVRFKAPPELKPSVSPPCLRPFLIRCVRRSPLALLVVRPGYGEEGVRIAPSPARPESREAGILAELLLLLWDGVCGVWRALRLGLLLLPCLLGACLTLLPAPLPSLSLSSLASLLTWTAEAAGPVYVKLGQWAATRRDLLPGEVCRGLARCWRRWRWCRGEVVVQG